VSEQSDVDLVRRGYEALARGDLEGLLSIADPEIEWHPPPNFPEPGPRRGIEAIRRGLRAYAETFEYFHTEPRRLLTTERPGEVLALARTRTCGKESGAEVTTEVAHLLTVRDGAVVRFEVIPDQREALRRVGLDPSLAGDV
jgi:ketosteroid isomerase-like protein